MKARAREQQLVSTAEREAKTQVEKSRWVEARIRSERLLNYAEKLYDFLHGKSGGPDLAESVFREADAIRYALNTAISVRLARFEQARKVKKK